MSGRRLGWSAALTRNRIEGIPSCGGVRNGVNQSRRFRFSLAVLEQSQVVAMRHAVRVFAVNRRTSIVFVAMFAGLVAGCGPTKPNETPMPSAAPASAAPSGSQPVPAQGPRPKAAAPTGGGRPPADFNGDGYRDLAVSKREAFEMPGLVQVLYGSATGLTAAASQQWSPADFGGIGSPGFGQALVSGDFDGDGFSDLAVGDPAWEVIRGQGGDVLVLYGSADGLRADRAQVWSQSSPAVRGRSEAKDQFGRALAAGNFGRGAEDDLAIGVPGENRHGAVHLLYGGAGGLTARNGEFWRLSSPDVPGQPRTGDRFGAALAAGEFDGGYDELVVGVPNWAGRRGAVLMLRGSTGGLTAQRAQRWQSGTDGIKGEKGASSFGDTLAVGQFSDSGELDLAVGNPGQSVGDVGSAGVVHVLYGTSRGLTAARNQLWSERVLGTERECECEAPEEHPQFGTALLAADFGRGSTDDLVIGVPEALTGGFDAGAVSVIYGTGSGLQKAHSRQFSHETRGIRGDDPDGANFGRSLAVAGPFTGSRYPTLVVGAPYYDPASDSFEGPGILNLIPGSARGLTAAGDQVLRARDIPQPPVGINFGTSLTS